MKFLAILFCLVTGALVGFGQDHAPTAEQCQSDKNLWSAQLTEYETAEAARMNTGVPNRTAVMELSFSAVRQRSRDMYDCAEAHPNKADDYSYVAGIYSSAVNDRYRFYVQRHHLTDQLLKEDAAGLRIP